MKRAVIVAAIGSSLLFIAAEARAACNGRPTDPAGYAGFSYGAAEVKSYATAQVRVHYATTGVHSPDMATTRPDSVPDTVALAADIGEGALTKYAAMGFKKIPSDVTCASNGGDDKIDIYLVHFTGADGSTAPECPGSGDCSSFALVEASFEGKGYKDAQEGFKTVVTHELFHAVQNVYHPKPDPFWAEGTAQWAMKTVHPELQDFERQLPAFFSDTTRSLDAAPSGVTAGFLYGSAVWPLFLATKFGAETIREIFEAEAAGNKDALPATDEVLQKKGSSLASAYPLFAAWNAGTGSAQKSAGGYPDAAKYPGIKIGKLEDGVNATTSGLSYYAYKGTLAEAQQIAFDGDATRVGGVVVPIEGGVAQLDKAKPLPANAEAGDVLVVLAGTTTKKTDAPFTVKFQPPGTEPSASSSSGTPAASSSGGGGGGGDDGCNVASSPSSGAGSSASFILVGAGAILALRSRRKKR